MAKTARGANIFRKLLNKVKVGGRMKKNTGHFILAVAYILAYEKTFDIRLVLKDFRERAKSNREDKGF